MLYQCVKSPSLPHVGVSGAPLPPKVENQSCKVTMPLHLKEYRYEVQGSEEEIIRIIREAVPGGRFLGFADGVRYRASYGPIIIWWSSTGTIAVQGKKDAAQFTRDRLHNYLFPQSRRSTP